MSVLTLASFGTSPGVTTAAVAMTLSWPRPVLLVEADASKPSSVLAGWLQGSIPADSGLIGVAQASFHRTISEQDVWDQAVELSGSEAATARWLLPAIAEPRAARGMRSFWADLFAVLRRISEQDVDVIIDAGRAEAVYAGVDEPLVAADIADAIAAWTTAPQVLVGQSLGGLTAAALAATHPDLVRELVIVDVTPGIDPDGDDIFLLDVVADGGDEADFTSDGQITYRAIGGVQGRKDVPMVPTVTSTLSPAFM